ncbi:type IVB secretion system protein IcmV [Candidatus Coxiella mudrowiae]|uniref:IcmV n=1 Tax=Candidatus Coxiella mudrowiae TaxID=2054173 RepID=A0ABM5UTJ1_9COXI|nr:type IVB secretion system protein IcmV [Candidatus Coxiella mudrowiae]AKQ33263.1 IcmV [Candidatus Coxiella mudrowiae]
MNFKKVVKKGFLSRLNPMCWVGYDQISGNEKTIKNLVDGLIDKPTQSASHKETFEECLRRFNLMEADIKKRMQTAIRIVILYLILNLGMNCLYCLFIHGLPLASFVCVILTLLLWAYAFREHFNYFQMRQPRLGCTFKEWFICTFKG